MGTSQRAWYGWSGSILKVDLSTGNIKKEPLDKKIFNELIDKFLAFKGFDPKTGFPTRSKLEKLDLGFVADVLEKTGRLTEQTHT